MLTTYSPESAMNEKRRITADTALRLSRFFGTSADLWLGLQIEYELREEREAKADLPATIAPHQQA